ncbi:MAG: pyridoxamine 5'-phosphate oxidase family protein [Chloroflexia bacterium]
MATKTSTRDADIKALGEKIKSVRFAMLTTIESDGTLKSRPMTTQQVEFDGDIWFFVGLDGDSVTAIKANENVNLGYAKPDDNLYVSVTGKAEIVNDDAKKKEFWNPLFKAWFPDGLEDPSLGLIKVTVTSAEYWDSPSSLVVTLVGFAKALITHEEYDGGDSQNKEIELAKK